MRKILCLLGVHRRSVEQRRRDGGGLYRSVCRRCGIGMVRDGGTGRWLAMTSRDRRARLRPLGRMLDRMTGPVVFLLLVALALGIAVYLRGPDDFWR